MKIREQDQPHLAGGAGFTIAEVMIASAIAALSMAAVLQGYVQSAKRAEWGAYNLAGHSLALQRMEQTRAARWDINAFPTVTDELVATNFPVVVATLDIPFSGTNLVYATNVTTITTVATNPPLKMIRVDCSWPFQVTKVFTNTIVVYRAPD